MAAPEQHRNNHNSNGNGSGNSNGNGLLSPSHAIPVREVGIFQGDRSAFCDAPPNPKATLTDVDMCVYRCTNSNHQMQQTTHYCQRVGQGRWIQVDWEFNDRHLVRLSRSMMGRRCGRVRTRLSRLRIPL